MSVIRSTIFSSMILLSIKVVHRTIGLVSIIILARILTPSDFGIVAIATMLVFFCDVISETGSQQYIVSKLDLSPDDINTSFTLNFLLKTVIGISLYILAPFISNFFDDHRLAGAIRVLVWILPLSALSNPGLHLLRRSFHYKPIFVLQITEKVISTIITIYIAYAYKTYWAMILGVVISYTYRSVFSYFISSYRPNFTLKKLNVQWYFSQWLLLKSIIGYSKAEYDTFMISKIFSLESAGAFMMMKNLSSIPAREFIKPITEPLLAVFSKSEGDIGTLSRHVFLSMVFLLYIFFPLSIFLFVFDRQIVHLLLGDDWLPYAEVLGILSLLIINFSLVSVFQEALIAIGRVKLIFYYDLVTFILLILLLSLNDFSSIDAFTIARVVLAMASVIPLTLIVFKIFDIRLLTFLILFSYSILSAYLAWAASLLYSPEHLGGPLDLLMELVVSSIIFFSSYLIFCSIFIFMVRSAPTMEFKEFLKNVFNSIFYKFKK